VLMKYERGDTLFTGMKFYLARTREGRTTEKEVKISQQKDHWEATMSGMNYLLVYKN
jgi:hypothetical protein